jgi:hypothetical protein
VTTNFDKLPAPLQYKLLHEDICGPDNWHGQRKQPEAERFGVDGINPQDIWDTRRGGKKPKHE